MFTSSIGKKLVMGLTGLFLIVFLIVHVSLNACIFADLFNPEDNGQMFNKGAHFMASMVLIRILEIGLMAGILLHIVQGFMLVALNRKSRSIGYDKPMTTGSKWYSRSMGLLGTLILLFLVLHFSHFWVPARFTEAGLDIPVEYNGVLMHDMFGLMKTTFSELWVVIVYVLGCISLCWHLMHGFQSAFRTVGVSNNRYLLLLNTIGIGFSVVVSLLFALMPIAMYLKWVE